MISSLNFCGMLRYHDAEKCNRIHYVFVKIVRWIKVLSDLLDASLSFLSDEDFCSPSGLLISFLSQKCITDRFA